MVMHLVKASWYADANNQRYLDSDLLPEGYQAVVTPNPTVEAKYSFRDDYDAIEKAVQSMFYVEMYDSDVEFLGNASGFVSFDEHLFVTNQHVIDGASFLKVWDEDENMYVLDQVVTSDETLDIALLQFPDGVKYDSLKMSTDELKRGQPVVAIGSPKGLQGTVSDGIISGFQKIPDYEDLRLIQINAAISPGSSGGALFDDNGKVIGITSSGLEEGQNLNFAVPIQAVQDLYALWDKSTTEKLGSRKSWNMSAFASSKSTEIIINGSPRIGSYEGELNKDVPDGQGVFQSDDGLPSLRYEGEWKNGEPYGKGTLKDEGYTIHFAPKRGDAYDRIGVFLGEVEDGKPKGQGSFTTHNLEGITWVYTGSFSNGTFNGNGERTWLNDDHYTEKGHYTNGFLDLTWTRLIQKLAKADKVELYPGSINFIQSNETVFTKKQAIEASLMDSKWNASVFVKNPASGSKLLARISDLTVVQTYVMEDYERDVSFLLLKDRNGVLFYGYIDGVCTLKKGSKLDSICLLPLNNYTHINTNGQKVSAIYCTFAKIGNKVNRISNRNTLDIPYTYWVELGSELSVSFDLENEKTAETVAYAEIYGKRFIQIRQANKDAQ